MEAKSLETLQTEHRHGFIAQHPLLFWADTVGDGSITKKSYRDSFFECLLACACSQMVILKEKHRQWQKMMETSKSMVDRWLWRFYVGICCIFSELTTRTKVSSKLRKLRSGHQMVWWSRTSCLALYVCMYIFYTCIPVIKIGVWCECVRTG